MIAIVDYGVGNLRSVQKALESLGQQAAVTSDRTVLDAADGVILPGVGAFGDAMASLRRLGLEGALKENAKSGKPLLGICLGMQLLFSVSEEHGQHVGLGLIPGHVRRLHGDFKIPHVGWNSLRLVRRSPLTTGLDGGEMAYFVHSYYVEPMDGGVLVATTDYFRDLPAIVSRDNVHGMQFHPEKSAAAGLHLLGNFAALCAPGVRV